MTVVRMWQVYRHYNIYDELLYIGHATDIMRRQQEHSKGTFWFNDVVTIKVEHYPTKAAAEYAEVLAIIKEQPTYNINHKTSKMLF